MSSILTVAQLNKYVGYKLKTDVKLKGVAVKGELSNFGVNSRSGHAYFTLKDAEAAVRGVMFANVVSRLRFTPENGMSVLAVGNVELYERDGTYQIIVNELQPLGVGAVSLGLEQLKRRLADLGVFDPNAKRPIPKRPRKIAVVTSPTGAALQDILNVLKRRYPLIQVEVFGTLVQGEKAPQSIASALEKADRSGADTLILARGGGSDEDLMAFNTEKVTMAVYNCNTPVISAVGHEVDTSLSDYAADLRAPTPSAAAELAVPDMSAIRDRLLSLTAALSVSFGNYLAENSHRLEMLGHRLGAVSPANTLTVSRRNTEDLEARLSRAADLIIQKKRSEQERIASQLSALSPFGILGRGYSIALKNGRPVSSVGEIMPGDELELILSDGTAGIKITNIKVN